MLFARATMGLATADLLPEDALRTFQASDTLHVDLTPPASRQKRYLRSAANVMTTGSGEVSRLAELTPLVSNPLRESQIQGEQKLAVFAKLRESASTTASKIKIFFGLRAKTHKTPVQKLKSMRLSDQENLFENKKFLEWKKFVEKTTPKEDVTKVMFEAMLDTLGKPTLVKILARAKSSTDTVKSLRDYQIEKWIQKRYKPIDAFVTLNLRICKELPNLPGFSMWAAFNTKKKSVKHAFLLLRGQDTFINHELMTALAKIDAKNDNFDFAQGVLYHQLEYLFEKKVPLESFYPLITKNPEDPLVRLWVDYVHEHTTTNVFATG